MAGITAVELGAESCAFARTAVRRGEVHVSAAEVLDPAAFPGIDAFTTALSQTRRSLRLPRRCRAVVWGLPDGANRKDAAVKPLLRPLTGAGFKVERVVSPCNALAALARMKFSRGEGSTCWLAINRGGVAIVVVRPGKQLYAHSFAWDSSVGASGSQARLLQRYSLVSFLSPEVKRAMAEARRYGTPVDAVVTCGNLPDLRSLTMPLIEELDVEVETLDSLEGLVVKPQAAEKLAEIAPGIRLACAAAVARGTRPWDPSKNRTGSQAVGLYVRVAALAAAVAGLGYLWYLKIPAAPPAPVITASRIEGRGSVPGKPGPTPPAVSAPTAAKANPPAVSGPPPAPKSSPSAVSVPPSAPKANPPAVTAQAPAPKPNLPVAPGKPGNDPRGATATAPKSAPPAVSGPPKKPESNPSVATVPAPAPKSAQPAVRPPPPTSAAPAPAIPWRAPAVTAPPRTPSVPPAVSSAAGRGSRSSVPDPRTSAPPKATPPVTAANTVPHVRVQPLVTMPGPRTSAPSAPRAPRAAVASPPPPAVTPRSNPPAVSAPAPAPKSNPPPASAPPIRASNPDPRTSALITPTVPADKPDAAAAARTAGPGAQGGPRGPMPALLKDAVPRVTAILVARDRRFATVDGGQIIGIGDLLGRRTVIGMDERSVVFQEPSGVQIRIGLGGRLLGVERGTR